MSGEEDPTAGLDVSPIPGLGTIGPAQLTQLLNAKQALEQAVARTGRSDQALADLGAGTDADFVQGALDFFDNWEHQKLYDSVNGPAGMNVTGLNTLRKAWHDGFAELANLSTFTNLGLTRIFSEGQWDGSSGDAALAAATRHAQAANQIAQVFGAMSDRMDTVAAAAEATRAAVPPPVAPMGTIDPDDPLQSILPGLVSPEYVTQHRQAAENARLAAVAAMNNVYTPNYPPAGNGVPSYATVASIGDDSGGGASGPSGSSPAASPGATGGSATETPTTAPADEPTTPATGDPSTNGVAADSQNEDTNSAGSEAETAAASTAAAAVGQEAGSRTGASPGGASGNPSGAGGGSGTSAPVGGLTSGAPKTPGGTAVSPIAGAPNSGRSGSAGGTGTPGTTTSAGRAAGPMGAPGAGAGRRGGGDDETEKYAPDYLRGVLPDWTSNISANSGVLGENPKLGEARDVPLARPLPVAPPVAQLTSARPDSSDTSNSGLSATASASSNAAPAVAEPGNDAAAPARTATSPAPTAVTSAEAPSTPTSTPTVTGEAPMLDDLFAEYGWDTSEPIPSEASPSSDEVR